MTGFCICLVNVSQSFKWFVQLGHFNKILPKTPVKETPQGNILESFLLNTLETTFWMENLTQRWKQSEPFFQKSGIFCRFSKRAGEVSPLPLSCAPVSVTEYASVSLNIPKYPWKYLNKLFWLCQGSEYAWSSYIFDRLLKMPPVLNKPGFWIWHSCICKGYA